jgi:DNA-binding NarL/FixJ family response regulator
MPRKVFTPHALNVLREMAAAGHSARQIAEALGSTAGSIRVKCSQLKVRLCQQPKNASPSRLHLSFMFAAAESEALRRAAAERCVEPLQLGRMILRAVLRDDLIKAVLDND